MLSQQPLCCCSRVRDGCDGNPLWEGRTSGRVWGVLGGSRRGAVESSWVWSLWNSFCLAQSSVALSRPSFHHRTPFQNQIKKKHIFFSLLISSIIHMARGHDQPNPALIIEGSRRPQPSKRVQGRDYPVFASEELQKRDKGTY